MYCPAVASRNLCTGVPRHCKLLMGQERAGARFSFKVACNAAEHPFAQSRVAVGAGNHGARPDIGSDVLELTGHPAGLLGNDAVRRDAVPAQPRRHVCNMRERIRTTTVLLGNFRIVTSFAAARSGKASNTARRASRT